MQRLDETLARLEEAKLRWMSGGVADVRQDAFCNENSDGSAGVGQLRLLAQAAVFRQSCLRPSVPQNLYHSAKLPQFAYPLLPETLRPSFRQMMQANDRSIWKGVVGLMAARGVMAHPFDWLPPKDIDGFPDAYAALAKWRAGGAQTEEQMGLTADTWDDLYPAERRIAFVSLRGADPDTARALMETHGGSLGAEDRLALVKCFGTGLTEADVPYLEALTTNDRSAKVKFCALGLLGRLDATAGGDERIAAAKELAAFMEQRTKGMLRRRNTVALRAKLNTAQVRRTSELFGVVSFTELAQALGITPMMLAESYETSDSPVHSPFMQMCAFSAPDAALMTYWGRLVKTGGASFAMLSLMAERLERAEVLAQVQALLARNVPTDMRDVFAMTGPDVGGQMSDAVLASPFYKSQFEAFKTARAHRAKGEGDYQTTHTITQFESLVLYLGFLLTRRHAQKLLTALEAIGVHSADPILRPLTFNIALKGTDL